MTTRQLDRVLTSYCNMENKSESPDAALLPKVLQNSESIDETFAEDENRTFSQFLMTHISQQSLLFGAFFALHWFALTILDPYLSVYYKQLGFSAKQIGLISSVRPFLAIFYCPFIGYIADKFSISRYILVASLVLTPITFMAMFLVPNIRTRECSNCSGSLSSNAINKSFDNCTPVIAKLSLSANVTSTDMYNTHDLGTVFIYLLVVSVLVQIAFASVIPFSQGYLLTTLGPTRRNQYGYFKGIGQIGSGVG